MRGTGVGVDQNSLVVIISLGSHSFVKEQLNSTILPGRTYEHMNASYCILLTQFTLNPQFQLPFCHITEMFMAPL